MEKNNNGKCGVCKIEHFERNNYFYGKLLTARDFKDEQCYFNEKRWLINRMIHGWGVVCGLDVHFEDCGEECIQVESSCKKKNQCNIVIEPGLAIDCCGREILVCEKQYITLDQVEPQCNSDSKNQEPGVKKFVICLEYDECKTEAITLAPSMCSQSEKTNFNRIRDHFKIRLKYASDVKIQGYKRDFCQPTERLEYWEGQHDIKQHDVNEINCEQYETLNSYLCNKLRDGCPDCARGGCLVLAEITAEPLGDAKDKSYPNPGQQEQQEQHLDPRQQEQEEEPHKPQIKLSIDPCSKRRLVYNNKMLFDLIHCFHDDLPHIIEISWMNCHGRMDVSWNEFLEYVIKDGLTVTFDQKMNPATINRHTFLISFKFGDRPSGTIVRKFIPVNEIIEFENKCFYQLTINEDWIAEEIEAKNSELFNGIDVDITLRSSLILGANGKALDGNFIGNKLPTGNGVQGGDFVSYFSVLKKGAKPPVGQDKEQADIYRVT